MTLGQHGDLKREAFLFSMGQWNCGKGWKTLRGDVRRKLERQSTHQACPKITLSEGENVLMYKHVWDVWAHLCAGAHVCACMWRLCELEFLERSHLSRAVS